VDLAVFHQQPLFEYLVGWQLIGHEEGRSNEGAELWKGRPLTPPAHLHGRPPEQSGPLPERFDDSGMRVVFPEDGFWLDIQLCEHSGVDWVLSADPLVTAPLDGSIRRSPWGLPTVTPDVILFLKATMYEGTKNHLRPRDEADFVTLLPHLAPERRRWLHKAMLGVNRGHPWQHHLAL
jgi:hypothetical protein